MMSEIEIAHWAVLISKAKLCRQDKNNAHSMLLFMAILAKKCLVPESEYKVFDSFLNQNYPREMEKFRTLITSSNIEAQSEEISMIEVNIKYSWLFSTPYSPELAEKIFDVNFVIDSMEDEHVRRDVHTTKIKEEQGPRGRVVATKHGQPIRDVSRSRETGH